MPNDRLPPVWLLGLANLPLGISGAVALITVPQLLAARHVPEPTIAGITALALVPSFASVLLAPVLDVRFSRRSYAVGFNLLSAVFLYGALTGIADLRVAATGLFAGIFASQLAYGALGGWFGSLVAPADESRLGAWLTAANIGGFGITAVVAIFLLRRLPYEIGAGILMLLMLLPMLIFVMLPAPGPDRRLAGESFGQFFGEFVTLLSRRSVLRTMALFVLPCASFALTNTLGGLGADFHTDEATVALLAGVGATVAGVAGSLVVPRLTRRISPPALYLLIGAAGALCTLALLPLPRDTATFAFAMIAENLGQAMAFSTAVAIILTEIGHDNPLAASQFTIMTAGYAVPLTYMQWLDGQAYGRGGLAATLVTDAGLSLAAVAVLAVLLAKWRRRTAAPLAA